MDEQTVNRYMALHSGLPEAFGTGQGRWIKRPPAFSDFDAHLSGNGPGLGIAPLRRDATVLFAAIDLDEPDFEAAREMQQYVPGPSFLERSRSGNAHVLVYFSHPIEAWIVRGILKEAILAAGKGAVEIFPKQDKLYDEKALGNYLNLSYYGTSRPMLRSDDSEYTLSEFLDAAEATRNDPEKWADRARWLMIVPPELREKSSVEFGEQAELHMCAEWIVAQREENPLIEGHRNAVMFALAKQLSNYVGFDHDEVWGLLKLVNDASPDPMPLIEIKRILANAERGRYTATDCDNPLVQPYCHPECPIAYPKGSK